MLELLVGYGLYAIYSNSKRIIEVGKKVLENPKLYYYRARFEAEEKFGYPIASEASFEKSEEYNNILEKYERRISLGKDRRITPDGIKKLLSDYDIKKGFFRRRFWDSAGVRDLRHFANYKMKEYTDDEGYVNLDNFMIDGNPFDSGEGYACAIWRATKTHYGVFSLTGEIYQKLIDAKLSYEDFQIAKSPLTKEEEKNPSAARAKQRDELNSRYVYKNNYIKKVQEDLDEPACSCLPLTRKRKLK